MAIDFHNHLIPGVDDGAQTIEESLDALERFRKDGVEAVVATPHIDASLTLEPPRLQERLAEIDAGWTLLTDAAKGHFPGIRLYRGCELALDVPAPDLSDGRLRLNGGRFVLLEFPFMTVPPKSNHVIGSIRETGYVPIIAHPERYHGVNGLDEARSWRASGGLLQLNGASLLGRYGAGPRRLAFAMLAESLADFVCSDYHARGEPQTRDYGALLVSMGAAEQKTTLMKTNAARMLEGLEPLPVAAVRTTKPSLWRRMSKLFD